MKDYIPPLVRLRELGQFAMFPTGTIGPKINDALKMATDFEANGEFDKANDYLEYSLALDTMN